MKAKGVRFTKPIGEEEWGRYAHFNDSDGNRLQIYQPNPGYWKGFFDSTFPRESQGLVVG